MTNIVKQTVKKLIYGPLSPIASITFRIISNLEYKYFNSKWKKQGWKKPDQSEIDFVRENVTINRGTAAKGKTILSTMMPAVHSSRLTRV